MNRTWWAVVAAVVIATGLSFAASRWLARPEAVHMHDTQWLQRTLSLTDDQVAAIRKLEKDYQAKMETCCAQHCSARYELSQSLADPALASQWVEKMCAAQAESEKATLAHILRVRAVLTPPQQERYAALINQQLCTACPMGMHSR